MLQVAVFAVMSSVPALLQVDHAKSLAPYVPSPQPIVERMLDAAQLKPGETVVDLGCGDGRILITAAKKYGAKAIGFELNRKLVALAREDAERQKLSGSVSIIEGNLLDADLTGADVVTLYLLTDSNSKLRPNLEKYLRPGARVVSHDFEISGWKPKTVEEVHVHGRNHKIYVYQIEKK